LRRERSERLLLTRAKRTSFSTEACFFFNDGLFDRSLHAACFFLAEAGVFRSLMKKTSFRFKDGLFDRSLQSGLLVLAEACVFRWFSKRGLSFLTEAGVFPSFPKRGLFLVAEAFVFFVGSKRSGLFCLPKPSSFSSARKSGLFLFDRSWGLSMCLETRPFVVDRGGRFFPAKARSRSRLRQGRRLRRLACSRYAACSFGPKSWGLSLVPSKAACSCLTEAWAFRRFRNAACFVLADACAFLSFPQNAACFFFGRCLSLFDASFRQRRLFRLDCGFVSGRSLKKVSLVCIRLPKTRGFRPFFRHRGRNRTSVFFDEPF